MMKRKNTLSFAKYAKNTVWLSLFFGAAGFVATTANAQAVPSWDDKNEASSTAANENVIASQGLNITAATNLNAPVPTVDTNGVITAVPEQSVNLNLKANATHAGSNATGLDVGNVTLNFVKIDYPHTQQFAENVDVQAGDFKVVAEANANAGNAATNGIATAVRFASIQGGQSQLQSWNTTVVPNEETYNKTSQTSTTVDIKATASGREANGVISTAGGITADVVNIESKVTATPVKTTADGANPTTFVGGNANGIVLNGGAGNIVAREVSLKSEAEATAGNANGTILNNITAGESIVIDATAKTIAADINIDTALGTTRTGGTAIAMQGNINAVDADITVSADAEGGNAGGLVGNVTAEQVAIDASAKVSMIDATTDAAGNVTAVTGGNAVAIQGDITSTAVINEIADWAAGVDTPEMPKLSVNVKGTAETNFGNATAMNGNLTVGHTDTKAVVRNALPQQLTKDLSVDVNLKAEAGSLGENGAVNAGNATAMAGDISVSNTLNVDNYTVADDFAVPAKTPAELDAARSQIAPIALSELTAAGRLGKVEVNGSFEAKAIGGNATGIDGSIDLRTDVNLGQANYQTTQSFIAGNGVQVNAYGANGELLNAGEFDANGAWILKQDSNGNLVPIEVLKDANGNYVLGNPVAPVVYRTSFRGDFNADVKATAVGGNAIGIDTSNAVFDVATGTLTAENIYANINGDITAETKSRVTGYNAGTTNPNGSVGGNAIGINFNAANTIDTIINGNITASAEGGNAFGINDNGRGGALIGELNGKITATATKGITTYADVDGDGDLDAQAPAIGTATGIKANTANFAINGFVTAEAQMARDAAGNAVVVAANATGIDSGDGIITLNDGAYVSAKIAVLDDYESDTVTYTERRWNAARNDYDTSAFRGNAITSGTGTANINVTGNASVNGNINAGTALNISGNGVLAVAGDINSATINLTNGTSFLARTADAAGNLGSFTAVAPVVNYAQLGVIDGIVDPDYTSAQRAEDKNAYLSQVRENAIAGNATMLVGDKHELGTVGQVTGNQAFRVWNDTNTAATAMTGDQIAELKNQNGQYVTFDYTVSNNAVDANREVGLEVKKLSYFTEKAANANSAKLGAALDTIATIDELTQGDTEPLPEFQARQEERAIDIQERRDFKAAMEAAGLAGAGYNGTFNFGNFFPVANSYISQVNADMMMNMNNVQMYRLSAIADAKRAGKKVSPEAGSVASNFAEFQSINMLGSQDGGVNAAGFDFWSAGGVAAIERDFSDSFFAGLSLGGIYNKVEGNDDSNANSTNFLVNLYGEYSLTDIPLDFFLNLGFSHGWNEVSRVTDNGIASADFDSNSFYSLGGVAYTFSNVLTEGLSIKPMLMYNLAYSMNDGSDESGAGFYNASTDDYDHLNFKTLLGVEIRYDIDASFAVVGRAFWAHEFGDTSYDVDYRIAAASFMPWATFEGEKVGRDSAILGIGAQYKFTDDISAFLDYSATIREDYLSHGLNLGAQFRF